MVDGRNINCHLSGKMLHEAHSNEALPVVGDWCAIGDIFTDETNSPAALIAEILPRVSSFARMVAGVDADQQLLASNIDYAFLVTSANHNFNVNRLRRYTLLARHGKVTPVIVLSKSDLAEGLEHMYTQQIESVLPQIDIVATSAVNLIGIDTIRDYLRTGKTAVFLGSSGVGKSTLVNVLLNSQTQKTGAVRELDSKGRHTTSVADLFFATSGGMIIDTPGLREVQVLGDEGDLAEVMPDVTLLASSCKFSDCSHSNEPGCQIKQALEENRLEQTDLDNYYKLQSEMAYARRKLDQRAANQERNRWKKITMQMRNIQKNKRGER